ncbi:CG12231 [Drosophila busckii]|uniref:CG12231 n=1 Tax=Drosophila busckii TaxID=30019 RepID=A0A0M4FAX7_DROBS|nr:deubiquitinase DESI2 [Drosophila busckii]ALC50025.1 CG12231 [Drosophila busckii]
MSALLNRLSMLNCFKGTADSCDEPPNVDMFREPVILNVYDIFNMNEYVGPIGLGIFHTGVEVYGVEYTYGGHTFDSSGIFSMTPRSAEPELGEQFRYRESIQLGYTQFTQSEVLRIVEQMGCQFPGNSYHLTNNNCNHFSNKLTHILCGRHIPSWINRLASFFACLPFLERCLPPQWLSPA